MRLSEALVLHEGVLTAEGPRSQPRPASEPPR